MGHAGTLCIMHGFKWTNSDVEYLDSGSTKLAGKTEEGILVRSTGTGSTSPSSSSVL